MPAMIDFIIGIALLLGLVGLAIWTGRGRPSGGNVSNVDAARRYGSGWHG
jgi:hypothetical protein